MSKEKRPAETVHVDAGVIPLREQIINYLTRSNEKNIHKKADRIIDIVDKYQEMQYNLNLIDDFVYWRYDKNNNIEFCMTCDNCGELQVEPTNIRKEAIYKFYSSGWIIKKNDFGIRFVNCPKCK